MFCQNQSIPSKDIVLSSHSKTAFETGSPDSIFPYLISYPCNFFCQNSPISSKDRANSRKYANADTDEITKYMKGCCYVSKTPYCPIAMFYMFHTFTGCNQTGWIKTVYLTYLLYIMYFIGKRKSLKMLSFNFQLTRILRLFNTDRFI